MRGSGVPGAILFARGSLGGGKRGDRRLARDEVHSSLAPAMHTVDATAAAAGFIRVAVFLHLSCGCL